MTSLLADRAEEMPPTPPVMRPLFRDDPLRHRLIRFPRGTREAGFRIVPGITSKRGSKSTMVEASFRQRGDVALDLRGAIGNLGFQRLHAHHGLLQVGAIDG